MSTSPASPVRRRETRRDFIRKSAAVTALVSSPEFLRPAVGAQPTAKRVVLILDRRDPLSATQPVQWAAGQLRQALQARQIDLLDAASLEGAPVGGECILAGGRESATARQILGSTGTVLAPSPEALALVRGRAGNRSVLLAGGSDVRGLVYALLELADRVTSAGDPLAELRSLRPSAEQPANPVRSVARLFTSDVEDKGWFHDKGFWDAYLTMLAAQRFNRFSLTLGLGYNHPRNVPDSYFYFAYPFLLAVPGFNVRAGGLPDAERDRNLAMLRWIGDETKGRGLHFQLGVWTHAYEFASSPNVNHPITGLTPENHAPYCRAALKQLLQTCAAIDGITFRCHSESGIPQGSYGFWPMIFAGVADSGRRVEIDIHSKGIEHKLLQLALATGLPVNVSPKYWAEHMGLPYHQTGIQRGEKFQAVAGKTPTIEQERRFTRYGYADYLREDRAYGVLYRMWPGTQRFLLWGDPAIAAGYGRTANFCGSLGLELCEPLSFKGRMGSGLAGDRNGYADARLRPAGGDWKKHLITYRQWGRLLYNPDTDPDGWRRYLRGEFGPAAADCEAALAQASRILPLVTTAHLPSASNNQYWPEIGTNLPIVGNRFAAVNAIDPGLFCSVDECAEELAQAKRSGKYTPLQVAAWLDGLADGADSHLAKARLLVAPPDSPAFQRLAADVSIQSGTGRFLAQKLRAAVAYALYQRQKSRALLSQALTHYRAARDTWRKIANAAAVYQEDLTYGREPVLRGHWADRLPAIDSDLAAMEKIWREAEEKPGTDRAIGLLTAALATAANSSARPHGRHVPPASFRRGEAVSVEVALDARDDVAGARLHYRHVNQGEEPRIVELARDRDRYRHSIPGEYTDSPYALMYFFEFRAANGTAWFSPGLAPDLSNQPYFVVRQSYPKG